MIQFSKINDHCSFGCGACVLTLQCNSRKIDLFQSVAKFHLCRNILFLSQTTLLRNGILCLLFEQLTECCTMLHRSITYHLLPDIHLRNNIDYVFWCIEHMLSYCETESVKGLSRQLISNCSTHFRQFLFYTYKDFPSFAYSLWHICQLLEHVQEKCKA